MGNTAVTGPVDAREVVARWNRNLADYVQLLAEVAGGEVEEHDGVVLFAGAHTYPGTHTNGVLRVPDAAPPGAAEVLALADDFFASRHRSYTVWIRDEADSDLEDAVRKRGFALHPPEAGMPMIACTEAFDPDAHPLAPCAEMRRVTSLREALDCLMTAGLAVGMRMEPRQLARVFFHPRALLDPRVDAFVAYLDGRPASCCVSFCSAGFAGLYSGATLDVARGRGLGRATFCAAANAGLARGAVATGGTSSDLGTPIWTRMGCTAHGRWRRWFGCHG